MNQKLEELGLGETSHFTNCVGIHNENHYSTAYDIAIITKYAQLIINPRLHSVLSFLIK